MESKACVTLLRPGVPWGSTACLPLCPQAFNSRFGKKGRRTKRKERVVSLELMSGADTSSPNSSRCQRPSHLGKPKSCLCLLAPKTLLSVGE
jgi:hypothetical protein